MTKIEEALTETDEADREKARVWLAKQGVTDDESATAFIEEHGFTSFAEGVASFKKYAGDDDTVNARVANILNTAAEEITDAIDGDDEDNVFASIVPPVQKSEDDVMSDLLDSIGVQLKKAVDVGNAAVVCLIAERLPAVLDEIEANSGDHNKMLLQKGRDVAGWFSDAVDSMVADGILEVEHDDDVIPITKADEDAGIIPTVLESRLAGATAEYIETGDAEPLLDAYQAKQNAAIASVEKAADEARDAFDHDHALDVLAEAVAKARNTTVEAGHAYAFDNDPTYRELFKQRQVKVAKRDARIVRTSIDGDAHEDALRKDRNARSHIVWTRLTAAAREANYDPEDKASLFKFIENEGAALYKEFIEAGGREVRRVTRRGGAT